MFGALHFDRAGPYKIHSFGEYLGSKGQIFLVIYSIQMGYPSENPFMVNVEAVKCTHSLLGSFSPYPSPDRYEVVNFDVKSPTIPNQLTEIFGFEFSSIVVGFA